MPTTLSALSSVSLLNRMDTKYLLPGSYLPEMLSALSSDYQILDIDGRRAHQYRTIYLDTAAFALYQEHHAGQPVRHKVRSRTYVETGQSFFEIKMKTETGRTVKYRLETDEPLPDLTPAARRLMATHVPARFQDVRTALRNDFRRITLAGRRNAERLTLDLGIQFERDGRTAVLPGVVIAELKQSGLDTASPFARLMREQQVRSTSLSKYCLGLAMLVSGIDHRAFDAQLQAVSLLGRNQSTASAALTTSY